jgi:hypothetical protein
MVSWTTHIRVHLGRATRHFKAFQGSLESPVRCFEVSLAKGKNKGADLCGGHPTKDKSDGKQPAPALEEQFLFHHS